VRFPTPRATVLALAVALCAVAAAPAHATIVRQAADPAGDAATPDPGVDIVAVGFGYDRASGTLAAAVGLRGEPATPAIVSVVAARSDATGCNRGPAIGFGSTLGSYDAFWQRMASPTVATASGDAGKQGAGDVFQRFDVTDRRLAGVRPDCLMVSLVDAVDTQVVYDSVGPLALNRRPGLAVRLSGVPEDVRAGRKYRLRVHVSNPGDARTAGIRVRLAGVRGLTASPRTVVLRPLAAGKRRTATITVRLSARARFATDLEVTAAASRLRASAERRVYVKTPDPPRRRPSPGGGGGGGVCVQYFPDLSGESGGSLGIVPC
jgi:hypothetical protein